MKAEPSFKLTDAQYDALVGAFQQDKEVRNQAEKLLQKKPKEKKGKDESRAEKSHSSSTPQQYKPLGKIDLDSIGRKPAAQKSSPKTDKPERLTPSLRQRLLPSVRSRRKATERKKHRCRAPQLLLPQLQLKRKLKTYKIKSPWFRNKRTNKKTKSRSL